MNYFWMLESFFLFCIFGYTISSIMAKREGFCFRLVMNMTLHILGYSKSRKGEFTQMLMSRASFAFPTCLAPLKLQQAKVFILF